MSNQKLGEVIKKIKSQNINIILYANQNIIEDFQFNNEKETEKFIKLIKYLFGKNVSIGGYELDCGKISFGTTFSRDYLDCMSLEYLALNDNIEKIKDEYLNDVYGVYPLRDGKKEMIIIHTSPLISNYFRSHKVHESQEIDIQEGGDAIITFNLVPSMELVRLFLSYGNQLVVKQPKRLVAFIEKNRD